MAATLPARRIAAALGAPAALFLLCLWLLFHIADPAALRVSRGRFGPGFWPSVSLVTSAGLAFLWFVFRAVRLRLAGLVASTPAAVVYDWWRAVAGVVLSVVYGFAIPIVGFAVSTLAFVFAWMALGGIRLRVLLPVGVAGTVVMLWFFAGVAKIPLDLGYGPFETATVAAYRLLGIF